MDSQPRHRGRRQDGTTGRVQPERRRHDPRGGARDWTPTGGPVTRGLGGDQVTERARLTFEDAVQRVEPAAQAIITRLRGMAQAPDEVQVEFGLDLSAEAGAFIAAASATANFKIAMTWRRTEPSPAHA